MTADRRDAAAEVSQLALEAFASAVSGHLAQDDRVDMRSLLGSAFAAAFGAIEAASGEIDLDEGWRLPGSLDRLHHLEAGELTDPDWQEAALPDDGGELVDLLSEAVEEIEWLAGLDDSGYAGFPSSGSTDFYAVHHDGRVFWFQTNIDLADAYLLKYAHRDGDEAGRRRLLEYLIEDFLGAGFVDVSLGDAFDDALLAHLRRYSESVGGAPWSTGMLSEDLADEEALADQAAQLAPLLRLEAPEVYRSLLRLRVAPDEAPESELDQVVAWNVVWPDLGFRT